MLLGGEAADLILKEGQKAHLVHPLDQLLPGPDAAGVVPGQAVHDPGPIFHRHSRYLPFRYIKGIIAQPRPKCHADKMAGLGVAVGDPYHGPWLLIPVRSGYRPKDRRAVRETRSASARATASTVGFLYGMTFSTLSLVSPSPKAKGAPVKRGFPAERRK